MNNNYLSSVYNSETKITKQKCKQLKIETMKTVLLAIFTTLTATAVLASGNLTVNLASNAADLAVVEISNTSVSDFEIEISDEYGDRIYHMETTAPLSDFKKRYNLSNLANGDYWYTVKIDKEKISKQLSVNKGEVEVKEVRKTLEPFFHQEGDKIKLTYMNFPKENVTLYVYDDNFNLLEKSNLGKDFTIHKGIDMSDLDRGTYRIVVSSNFENFRHSVTLN